MPIRLAISGHRGRMGQALQRLMEASAEVTYVGSVFDAQHRLCVDVCEQADVIIDFATPEATQVLLQQVAKPILIGTTGHALPLQSTLGIPILYAPNTSPGIQLLRQALVAIAPYLDDADIEIVETHHKHKRDKPSGTALSLKATLEQLTHNRVPITIHALRGGGASGEHEVRFYWGEESLCLTHRSFSRDVYAKGAIKLALWLAKQKPGYYTMEDVFAGHTGHP